MIDWLREHPKPFLLVFTKLDKLSRQQWLRRLGQLTAAGTLAGLAYLPFSSVTGEGREEALEWIYQEAGLKGPNHGKPA
jgi:GTP-binding protein EngB required for normal cell division